MGERLRIVLMGTGPFAVPAFESLLKSPHQVQALVTRPTRNVHRRVPPAPTRRLAERHDLPVHTPESINAAEAIEWLGRQRPDLLVVCDYGEILSPAALATARLGGVNLHGSLLPKYRGAAPVHWAIWNGERETGVSLIHMTPKLDAGPVLVQRRTEIGEDETADQLERRLAEMGRSATLEAVEMLARWDGRQLLGVPQNPARASKAPRLKKSHGQIDWSQPAERIARQVRALQPWPGTFTHLQNPSSPLRLLVTRAEASERGPSGAAPGVVTAVDRDAITVATGDGSLRMLELKPSGKRAMSAGEFLRGRRLRPGDRFGNPPFGGSSALC